ncbi:MAG: DUF1269 domain-containing protein [Propionibacteriaceae bacterium]|nr:DUF1269 domain-containing protein [Propionibacteriaceae bacterium]
MATLTAWKFDEPEAAAAVRDKLVSAQKQQLIEIHDAVVVTWPADAKKPKTKQAFSPAAAGAAGGAFWGLLFGLIFFVPFFGAAFGAAMGAAMGSMSDFGINDDFIKSVREKVTPGTSALFLLTSGAVEDRIKEQLGGVGGELISTNLSVEDEAKLREMFAE